MKSKYKEKKISVIRALEHYIKSKMEYDLITNDDLIKIKENYVNY